MISLKQTKNYVHGSQLGRKSDKFGGKCAENLKM